MTGITFLGRSCDSPIAPACRNGSGARRRGTKARVAAEMTDGPSGGLRQRKGRRGAVRRAWRAPARLPPRKGGASAVEPEVADDCQPARPILLAWSSSSGPALSVRRRQARCGMRRVPLWKRFHPPRPDAPSVPSVIGENSRRKIAALRLRLRLRRRSLGCLANGCRGVRGTSSRLSGNSSSRALLAEC